MPSYKSRYTGKQVDALLGEVSKMSQKIDELELLKNTRPDYNQNDATQLDYIKNRPFYEIKTEIGNLVLRPQYDDFAWPDEIWEIPIDETELKDGDTLRIEFYDRGSTIIKEDKICDGRLGECGLLDINDDWDVEYYSADGFVMVNLSQDIDESTFVLDASVKIYKKEIVQLDEKFIPDIIARTSDLHEPLAYKEKTYILDKDLSGYTMSEFGDFLIEATELSEVEDYTPVVVELNDNGTVYTGNGVFVINSGVLDADGNPVFLGEYFIPMYSKGVLTLVGVREDLVGVTLKIYTETVKKIDKNFLPPNDVPHLVGTVTEPIQLANLESGVYVLEGSCNTRQGTFEICDFDYPSLCHIQNNDPDIRLFWFEGTPEGVYLHTRVLYEGAITEDRTFSLADIADTGSAAFESAQQAIGMAEEARHEAVSALQVAKGAARAQVYKTYKEMAEAFATMTADDVRVGDHIYIEQLDVPDLWVSKVHTTELESYYVYYTGDTSEELLISVLSSEGSVPVNTPWFEVSMLETQKVDLSGFVTEEEMDKTVGEINTALEEIIVLQEEILVPDGSEVKY